MNKKEIRKLFKHKWWEHLFCKYKYVEDGNYYREYEKFRLWFAIIIWIVLIAVSPILTLIALLAESEDWFSYPTGKNGRESYVYIKKVSDE